MCRNIASKASPILNDDKKMNRLASFVAVDTSRHYCCHHHAAADCGTTCSSRGFGGGRRSLVSIPEELELFEPSSQQLRHRSRWISECGSTPPPALPPSRIVVQNSKKMMMKSTSTRVTTTTIRWCCGRWEEEVIGRGQTETTTDTQNFMTRQPKALPPKCPQRSDETLL